MKYLITGITGFTGIHLSKLLLQEGHEIHGLVRSINGRSIEMLDVLTNDEYQRIKFIYGDLKSFHSIQKIFENNSYDGVFHLAAMAHIGESFNNPILTFEDNVIASVNLITVLQKTKIKLMFASSSQYYGDVSGLIKETAPIAPTNPYAVSKAAIDIYMQERMNNGFIDGYIVRTFSNTGPKRGNNYSVSSDAYQIARMMLDKQDYVLNIGNLKNKRAIIDVRDVCRAYYLLMKEPKSNGNIYNISGDELKTMQFYTDLLIKFSGIPYEKIEQRQHIQFARAKDVEEQIGDSTKLKELTQWKAQIPIEQTINDLLQYWVEKLR